MAEEMDDQQLVNIRYTLRHVQGVTPDEQEAWQLARTLMREVDILRGNIERLRAREAALVDFLQRFVANQDNPWVYEQVYAEEARALLAPGAEAAEGEGGGQ